MNANKTVVVDFPMSDVEAERISGVLFQIRSMLMQLEHAFKYKTGAELYAMTRYEHGPEGVNARVSYQGEVVTSINCTNSKAAYQFLMARLAARYPELVNTSSRKNFNIIVQLLSTILDVTVTTHYHKKLTVSSPVDISVNILFEYETHSNCFVGYGNDVQTARTAALNSMLQEGIDKLFNSSNPRSAI
nr:MAG: hypothetical protein [Wufeng shrew hepe-like virus 1]